MADEPKKYCFSAVVADASLSFVIPLTEEQFNMFQSMQLLQFNIGGGLMVAIDRNNVESFSIQPMQ